MQSTGNTQLAHTETCMLYLYTCTSRFEFFLNILLTFLQLKLNASRRFYYELSITFVEVALALLMLLFSVIFDVRSAVIRI